MANPPPILSADRGRAMATALLFLCLLATVEVILVVRAVSQAKGSASSPEKTPTPGPTASVSLPMPALSAPTRISPPPVGQLAAIAEPAVPTTPPTAGFGPPPIGSFQAPPISGAASPAPQAAPPVPSPPAPTPRPLPSAPPIATRAMPPGGPSKSADPAASMTLMEMVDLAKQVRSLGDMQGALEVLKRADLQFPGAPEVAVETALCYEQMGLKDKAVGLWKQIEGSTSAKSAGFADLAKRKLGQSAAAAASEPLAFSGSFGPKVLSLGACQALRDPGTANGEKVVLRIPILRQGNAPVDPAQVDINVYFFDRVNGEKIAQTIADEPLSAWGAPPVDWTGLGEEPLEVTYFLPTLTPGEITAHGRRSYHGYVVRLYYQDKLQDVAAEPRDLLDFGSREPQTLPGGGANPLLPPVAP